MEIYDNVFSKSTAFNLIKILRHMKDNNKHMHGHFFREQRNNVNPVEMIINQILDQIDDKSKMVEYWFRLTWTDMHCHQDVNESRLKEENEINLPNNGHILYLSEINNEAATMIFNKDLTVVSVVTPFIGRMVRFHGKAFHYVPSPFTSIFGDTPKLKTNKIRIVILFNTWDNYIPGKDEVTPIFPAVLSSSINAKNLWRPVPLLQHVRHFDESKSISNFSGLLQNDKNTIIRVRFMGDEKRRMGFKKWEYFHINNLIRNIGPLRSYLSYEIKNISDHHLETEELCSDDVNHDDDPFKTKIIQIDKSNEIFDHHL